jgi:hypothetical protein
MTRQGRIEGMIRRGDPIAAIVASDIVQPLAVTGHHNHGHPTIAAVAHTAVVHVVAAHGYYVDCGSNGFRFLGTFVVFLEAVSKYANANSNKDTTRLRRHRGLQWKDPSIHEFLELSIVSTTTTTVDTARQHHGAGHQANQGT